MTKTRPRPPAKHLRTPPFIDALPSPIYFRVAHMPANASYPQHSHRWGEFVYSFSGVMEVELQDSHYLIPPQYGLWLPPNVDHRGLNRQEALHCSVYVAAELTGKLPKKVCALTVDPLLRALFKHLQQQPPEFPHAAAQERLLQVILDLLEVAECAGSYLPSSSDAMLVPVLQALESNPGDERSMTDWASFVHTTERTLTRRFQSQLGMTLPQWRQRLRTIKAMPMLESGETVENVAQDLGYASASAFISMFHRLMGVTPDEYRKRDKAPLI